MWCAKYFFWKILPVKNEKKYSRNSFFSLKDENVNGKNEEM